MKQVNIKRLVYSSLMLAMVFVSTFAIKIPTFEGYIHPGDGFVFLSGIMLGPVYGALAAGLGSALSDILAGYTQWALPTFIIKALMAGIIGYLSTKKDNFKVTLLASGVFSFLWFSFIFIMKWLLGSQSATASDLVTELGLKTTDELLNLTQSLQSKLLIIAVAVPIILSIIIFLLRKITSTRFSSIYSLSFVISGSLMVVLYYFTQYILYGNMISPIFSIPANMVQFTIGLIIAHLLLPIAQKVSKV